jgi:hypothetical protein
MRRLASLSLAPLLATTLLVGCQGVNLPLTGAGARYGQLAFNPAGQSTIAMLGSKGSAEGRSAAPTAPSAGADMAMPAVAPMPMGMIAPYYGGYWGNEYELIATSEAKTAGFQGTYQQTLDSVVKPLVADWATDAVLRSAGGLTDDKGLNVKPTPVPSGSVDPLASPEPAMDKPMPAVMPIYGGPPSGWRFEFASRGKRESLHFFVAADSTLVVKQAYRERIQDLSGAKLNSAEVIAIVTKAIQDKSIQANDPHMPANAGGSSGGSAGSGVAIATPAIAPAPMRVAQTNPSTPVTSGPATPPPDARPAMPTEEELTTIPANAKWDLNLYLEPLPNQGNPDGTNPTPMQTRLVWNVGMQPDFSQMQTPGVGYSPAWARVDANTGALLSLSRPRKYTYGNMPGYEPRPMPADAGTAIPAPSPSPKS